MAKNYSELLSQLEDNTFVIIADESGARLVSKLRGATAVEMGTMLGAAKASLNRQIDSLRDHVRHKAGQVGVDWFDGGLVYGELKAPHDEGMMIREVPKKG